jgi:hypothetical protein
LVITPGDLNDASANIHKQIAITMYPLILTNTTRWGLRAQKQHDVSMILHPHL